MRAATPAAEPPNRSFIETFIDTPTMLTRAARTGETPPSHEDRSCFMRFRTLIWTAFAVTAAAVVYLTLRPGGTAPGFYMADKIQHAAAYATLAFLAGLGARSPASAAWWALGLAGAGYGLEIVQSFTGRSYDLYDAAANAAGCALGLIAALGARRTGRLKHVL